MADRMLLRGGNKASMPTLAHREIAIATDEKALYVGIGGVSVRIGGAGDRADIDSKLTATQMDGLPELSAGSDLAAVIGAYNSLISALKANGMMKEVI